MVDSDKSIPTDKDVNGTDAPSAEAVDLDHSLTDEEVDELVGQGILRAHSHTPLHHFIDFVSSTPRWNA